MAHWHDLADETSRHHLYRDMKANGVFIGKEPFLLVSHRASSRQRVLLLVSTTAPCARRKIMK